VKYKPGRQNGLADALSRRPDYELAHVTMVTSPVMDLARAAYARDDMCVALLRARSLKTRTRHYRRACARACAAILSMTGCCTTARVLKTLLVSWSLMMRI